MTPDQIESALLAAHNIANSLGAISVVIYGTGKTIGGAIIISAFLRTVFNK